MTSGQILEGRFELLQKIGRGGQATTWLARELERDKRVVIKHLALGQVEQWKHIERFEREGQVLASIDHPQIPDYISAIAVTDEGQVDFYPNGVESPVLKGGDE